MQLGRPIASSVPQEVVEYMSKAVEQVVRSCMDGSPLCSLPLSARITAPQRRDAGILAVSRMKSEQGVQLSAAPGLVVVRPLQTI
jgi:hypothetical protein